jgi:hypothetical protein
MFNFKTLEIMNLENLNLVELNAQEVQEVEGGLLWKDVAAAAGLCIAIYDGYNDFIDGWNSVK